MVKEFTLWRTIPLLTRMAKDNTQKNDYILPVHYQYGCNQSCQKAYSTSQRKLGITFRTQLQCSFTDSLKIRIDTKFLDDNGETNNCLNLSQEDLARREVDHIDIAFDPLDPKKYKEEEDLTKISSAKTGRGPLEEDWKTETKPVMCSYKVVDAQFPVWGFKTRAETYIQDAVRRILLLGHRQAAAWIDEWIDMDMDALRAYEATINEQTNLKTLGENGIVEALPEEQPEDVKPKDSHSPDQGDV